MTRATKWNMKLNASKMYSALLILNGKLHNSMIKNKKILFNLVYCFSSYNFPFRIGSDLVFFKVTRNFLPFISISVLKTYF